MPCFYADLHVHSRFSRACSHDCDLEHLALWAQKKGLSVLGTGDFTHPAWRAEIREKLVPAEPGLFRLRDDLEREVARRVPASCRRPVRFVLSVEISTIYSKEGRTRKIHHLVYVPDLEGADRVTRRLARIGNLASDGRPILGLDARHLLEIVLESGPGAYLVPAHAWTPWFSVLGSKAGFDSIEECYGDLAPHVFAIETGLSSDPPMNWRLSALDRYRLVSNSDAHSPARLGREACAFDTAVDYFAVRAALETGRGYAGTVEFFPEEGKYHLDGHRACGVRLAPAETRRQGGRCPACGRPVTVGVLHRVEELADRPEGVRPAGAAPFRSLVPLCEVLAEITGTGAASKAVAGACEALLGQLGPELFVLEQAPVEAIRRAGSPLLGEAIARMRAGAVIREAGFDGEYGVIRLFTADELRRGHAVGLLFPAAAGEPGGAGGGPGADEPAARGEPVPGGRPAAGGEAGSRGEPAAGGEADAGAGADLGGETGGPRPGGSGAPSAHRPAAGAAGRPGGRTDAAFGAGAHDAGGTDRLAGLDPEQRAAAAHTLGPLLVIAGPGTGKTRTLTHRIAHLIADHGVAPERCLAITFTRRAAAEMQERLATLLPGLAGRIPVTTFHALGLSILREHGGRIGLPPELRVAREGERVQLLAGALRVPERKAQRLLAEISRLKRTGGRPAAGSEVAAAFDAYRRVLAAEGLVDFDDLVGLAAELLEADPELAAQYRERFPWVSIDEYQDIDEQQYRLVRHLVGREGNLCAIGDPDQAIYGFRGADVRFFLRFQEDFPGARAVRLGRNYRTSRGILDASLQVIARSSSAAARTLRALVGEPTRVVIHEAATDRAEAEFVVRTIERMLGGSTFFALDSRRADPGHEARYSFADFAVLYRTEAQAGLLAEALFRSGIPFQQRSHERLSDRPAVEALVRALCRTAGGRPLADRLREAAVAARSGGGSGLPAGSRRGPGANESIGPRPGLDTAAGPEAVEVDAAAELLLPLAERCGADLERFLAELALGTGVDTWDPRADRVSLLTLHAAKGLEFRVVFIVGCEDGLLPLRWGRRDAGAAETARGSAGASVGPAEPEGRRGPASAGECPEAPAVEGGGAGSGERAAGEGGGGRSPRAEPPRSGASPGVRAAAGLGPDGADAPLSDEHPGAAAVEEERRLFYVGMTRARDRLVLSRARRRLWRGEVRDTAPSPFLRDIEEALLEREATGPGRRSQSRRPAGQLELF